MNILETFYIECGLTHCAYLDSLRHVSAKKVSSTQIQSAVTIQHWSNTWEVIKPKYETIFHLSTMLRKANMEQSLTVLY